MAGTDQTAVRSTLSRKILLTVILVTVLGNLLGALSINLLLRGRSRNLEEENLLRQGQTAARLLEDYWQRNGSWEGVDLFLDRFFPGWGDRNRGMHNDGTGMNHRRREAPPVLFYLMDAEGRLLYRSRELPPRTADFPGKVQTDFPGKVRLELTGNGRTIGWLIPVTPSHFMPKPPLVFFLDGLNLALFIVTISSALLILLVGSLTVRRLLKPLEAIAGGVRKIGAGDYSVRLDAGGAGELLVLQREFNRMAEAVGAADDWKKRLVSDTAHDLRTPLSLVLGQVEMIRDGIYPADAERLERIHGELQRLGHLIEEMEILARLESGTIPLALDEFPADAPVRELFAVFGEQSQKRGISLELQGESPSLAADYGKTLRVLRNLLENALVYTPDGGRITVTINAGTSSDGGPYVSLSVTDTGPGIPEGQEERIFQRFYRADPSRNRSSGGSGLGLAICRAVMEAHDGTVTAGNNPGGGACFTLRFPVVRIF